MNHDHVKVPLEIRVGLKNRENFSKSGDETRKVIEAYNVLKSILGEEARGSS